MVTKRHAFRSIALGLLVLIAMICVILLSRVRAVHLSQHVAAGYNEKHLQERGITDSFTLDRTSIVFESDEGGFSPFPKWRVYYAPHLEVELPLVWPRDSNMSHGFRLTEFYVE